MTKRDQLANILHDILIDNIDVSELLVGELIADFILNARPEKIKNEGIYYFDGDGTRYPAIEHNEYCKAIDLWTSNMLKG